jgi:hypothetical protein
MPREGIERILLKLKGGDKQLSKHTVPYWELGNSDTFTQRIFLASPRGSYLAWSDPDSGALRVRGGAARERVIARVAGRDARFSPDESRLAAIRSGDGDAAEVVVLDLVSGELSRLGSVGAPLWMEWVQGGVVVSHQEKDKVTITYMPLDGGKPSTVASGTATDLNGRFTTAKRGHLAMYFFQRRAYVVDVEAAEADARQVGELTANIDNAEMAPDGSEAAVVVIGGGIYRWKNGGELAQLGMETAHTVWYSADGSELAYASTEKAVVLAEGTRRELTAKDYDLNAMRFHGAELVVSMGSKALLWNPKTGTTKLLGRSAKGQTVQAADLYQGGTVLWTREIHRFGERGAPRNARFDALDLPD